MKTLLLPVHCGAEMFDAPNKFAVVLTPDLVERIKKASAAFMSANESCEDAYKLSCWCAEGEYSELDADDEILDEFNPQIVESFASSSTTTRTEFEMMHIAGDNLHWSAIVRHTSIEVETEMVSIAWLMAECENT